MTEGADSFFGIPGVVGAIPRLNLNCCESIQEL